ncbi:MAG: transcriptional regulator FtsR [Thermoleophilia bacterium]
MGSDSLGEFVEKGAAGASARARGEGLMTIGQVVDALREEFPNLSISKVRYLEDRGLLTPERTPGGYRKYNQTGVRALRSILILQRDEFMPLDVIKERLVRGTASVVGRALAPSGSFDGPRKLQRDDSSHTWAESLEITGVSEGFLRSLAEFHLFEERGSTGEPMLTDTDLEVVRICDILAKHGVEPRNLRVLRSSAEREAALLAQVAAPSLRSSHEERRQEGERLLADLGSLMARLLDLLLYKELTRLVG